MIYNFEQGSEAWHEERAGRITGTRFAALCAGESTKTFKDLINSVVGEIITEQREETYSNAIMERGVLMEPEAAEEYQEITGFKLEEVGLYSIDNELEQWVGVSPDRLVNDNGGLEIKCPMMKTHIGYLIKGVVPAEYIKQVQGCLYVTGREWWDFMSYYPGIKPLIVRVEPDKDMHQLFEDRINLVVGKVKEILTKYTSL